MTEPATAYELDLVAPAVIGLLLVVAGVVLHHTGHPEHSWGLIVAGFVVMLAGATRLAVVVVREARKW